MSKSIKFLAFIAIVVAAIYFGFQLKSKYGRAQKDNTILQKQLDEIKASNTKLTQSEEGFKNQISDLTEQIQQARKKEKLYQRQIQQLKGRVAVIHGHSNESKNGEQTEEGIVTAILYSEENPSAVIDNRIVHQGDIIKDITVVRINKNNVEFEKDGTVWTQRVRQRPNPAWKDKPTDD